MFSISRPSLAWLFVATLAVGIGCGAGDTPAQPEQASDPVDRQAKARRLFLDAGHAKPREKVELLRRLLALYPEFDDAVSAHLQLCLYLRDPVVARYAEVLTAVRTFAARHPLAPEVLEVFAWAAEDAQRPPAGWNGASFDDVARAWAEHLEAIRPKCSPETGDLLALLEGSRADLLSRRGDLAGARAALESAVAAPCAESSARLRLRWHLALLLPDDGPEAERCRELLDEVAALRAAGAKGPAPDEIAVRRARLPPGERR